MNETPPGPEDEELVALRANIRAERRSLARRLAWIGGLVELGGVTAWIVLHRVAGRAMGGTSARDVAVAQLLVVAPAIVAAGLLLLAMAAVVYARSNRV